MSSRKSENILDYVDAVPPPSNAKLGCRLPVFPLARVDLSKHFDTSTSYTPPPAVHRSHWDYPWQGLGNDQFSDCFPAAMVHAKTEWALNGNGKPLDTQYGTEQVTFDVYSQVAGFVQDQTQQDGSNPTDQGTDPNQAFHIWLTDGIHAFGGDKIDGIGAVPPTNMNLVERTIDEFEVLFTSFALPNFCQNQTVWDVPRDGNFGGDNAPGSWGYHEVITVSYDQNRFSFISWGQVRVMTKDFFRVYVMRADAVLDKSITNAKGVSATGLNYRTLNSDMATTYQRES